MVSGIAGESGAGEGHLGPSDRRVQAIHPTAKGRTVLKRVIRLADEENERIFSVLDDDERSVLQGLLLRIAEATH